MKKKVYAILLSLAMVVTMMPTMALTAFATDETPLPEETQVTNEEKTVAENESSEDQEKISQNIDENAEVNEDSDSVATSLMLANDANEEEKVINGDTTELSGAYTVRGHVIVNHRLEVKKDATINLEKGCELTVYGGIRVKEGCSLTIIGNGSLIIDGVPRRCAGIGGNNRENCGTVIIKGGTVTVTGGNGGAGIGGGNRGTGGKVTINGGTVTANGGHVVMDVSGGAGIGGGYEGAGDTVTINGGTVTANGGDDSSGIGGGEKCAGGTVTINGGIVEATGGKNGSGIGSGNMIRHAKYNPEIVAGTIEITGGIVTARGGLYGAGIGGGGRGKGADVTISGGNVTAIGGEGGAGIGGGTGATILNIGNGGTVKISNGIVTAIGGEEAAGIGGGHAGAAGTLIVTDGIITATGGVRASAIGKGYRCPPNKGVNVFEINNDKLIAFDISNAKSVIPIDRTKKDIPNNYERVLIREPADIAVEPTVVANSLVYNDKKQNGFTNEGAHVQIAGVTSAIDVGDYTFTAIPVEGCVWEDYTTDPKTYKWSIVKADYTDVAKTISAEVGAKRGQSVIIDLPIPEGARYGMPQKKVFNDSYWLSDIDEGNIILMMTRTATSSKPMIFTVPVIPDKNHYGYVITVTVTPKIDGSDDEGGSYDSGGTDIDPSKPSPDKQDAKSVNQSNISTGDSNEIVIYTVVGLMALIGIALALALKKRINR